MDNEKVLDSDLLAKSKHKRRRDLLPWWIKGFCWFFMLFGMAAVASFLFGLMGGTPFLAFYGFETKDPLSIIGLGVIVVGIIKGITAFTLWFEKDYAIRLGIFDAILGIVLCLIAMIFMPIIQPGYYSPIRLEIAFLVPYLVKLFGIKEDWRNMLEEPGF